MIKLVFIDALTCEFRDHGELLARYRAETGVAIKECPKPCLHPVFSLAGESITDFQPADHPWHHGIAWAFTYINGDTFWGGPTFQDREKGYGWLENHGSQRHIAWQAEQNSGAVGLVQTVHWIAARGHLLLVETRRISATTINPKTWELHFSSDFTNATTEPLSFTSPVGHGRPEGGYFGLMWRGPAAWAYGRIFSATNSPSMMGQAASWIGYERVAVNDQTITLLFIDDPQNPRFPTTWFVRNQDQPLASFAFAYAKPFDLAAGAQLQLRYTIAIIDSALDSAQAGQLAEATWVGH